MDLKDAMKNLECNGNVQEGLGPPAPGSLPIHGAPSAFANFGNSAGHFGLDQRSVWDTSRLGHPFQHTTQGLGGGSPTLSELTLLAAARHSASAAQGLSQSPQMHHEIHPAYRINPYVEHLYGSLHTSPVASLRGLSPALDPRAAGLALHADYAMQALGQRALNDLHASSSLFGSLEVPFLDGTRLNSPRPTPIRQSRKRALSNSPYSDSLDLGSMIRFSPNSLVSFMNGSRSSSTSGSYGHLSAGAMSPALGVPPTHLQQLQAHLMRSGSLGNMGNPSSPYLPSYLHHQSALAMQHQQNFFHLGGMHPQGFNLPGIKHESEPIPKESPNPVSSTVDEERSRNFKVKREATSTTTGSGEVDDEGGEGAGDEPGDFVETHCHWRDCSIEFSSQDELVKHINNDHIHANKKSFVCRWKECTREEKPFKAQYMLVVHMRRHTGEKPHRCTFEGCAKAYSRLENLKTHLRSHTGEKPYMCEFPGCSKAFSNASDRAKHQNRTHSNEKPYVCKAPGCTKRYTDPSSLRKHVKTVHGAEFYANKKHKGCDNSGPGPSPGSFGAPGSSPRSDDGGVKSTSSPSIKSEDPNSPGHFGSPATDPSMTPGRGHGEGGAHDDPISDNVVSTTTAIGGNCEEVWEAEESSDIEVPDVGVAVGVGGRGPMIQERNNQRNRMRSRLQAKGISSLPQLPLNGPRRGGIGDLNQRINDLRMGGGGGMTSITQNPGRRPQSQNLMQTPDRRDSSTTVSSYYGSMKSGTSPMPFSRRSSEVSQMSAVSGRNAMMASPFDPISPGSSRRSSATSTFQGGYSLNPNMVSQMQQINRRNMAHTDAAATEHLVAQTQNMSLQNGNCYHGAWPSNGMYNQPANQAQQQRGFQMAQQHQSRRASDPVRPVDRNAPIPFQNSSIVPSLQRYHSYNSVNGSVPRGNGCPVGNMQGQVPVIQDSRDNSRLNFAMQPICNSPRPMSAIGRSPRPDTAPPMAHYPNPAYNQVNSPQMNQVASPGSVYNYPVPSPAPGMVAPTPAPVYPLNYQQPCTPQGVGQQPCTPQMTMQQQSHTPQIPVQQQVCVPSRVGANPHGQMPQLIPIQNHAAHQQMSQAPVQQMATKPVQMINQPMQNGNMCMSNQQVPAEHFQNQMQMPQQQMMQQSVSTNQFSGQINQYQNGFQQNQGQYQNYNSQNYQYCQMSQSNCPQGTIPKPCNNCLNCAQNQAWSQNQGLSPNQFYQGNSFQQNGQFLPYATSNQNQAFQMNQQTPYPTVQQGTQMPYPANQADDQSAMQPEKYERTLAYVKQCQSWNASKDGKPEGVSSTSDPTKSVVKSNMVVNDLSSSLNSLAEENKFLQMIQ